MAVQSLGHLNPGDTEVAFDRFPIRLDELVRHVWMVRWAVPPGEVRPQRVLTYPACNVVFRPESALLLGPSRRIFVQELRGESWAVGVLFRPSAAPLLTATEPALLPAGGEPIASDVHPAVVAAVATPDAAAAREAVVAVLRPWLQPVARRVGAAGRLANDACHLAEERDDITRVADLASLAGTTPRQLGRVLRAHLGLSAKWLIECRRLQTAATRLFADPECKLAALAADLGYSDQAHFTRRYREILGETPGETRRAGTAAARWRSP